VEFVLDASFALHGRFEDEAPQGVYSEQGARLSKRNKWPQTNTDKTDKKSCFIRVHLWPIKFPESINRTLQAFPASGRINSGTWKGHQSRGLSLATSGDRLGASRHIHPAPRIRTLWQSCSEGPACNWQPNNKVTAYPPSFGIAFAGTRSPRLTPVPPRRQAEPHSFLR
jgi:hypothetical protein